MRRQTGRIFRVHYQDGTVEESNTAKLVRWTEDKNALEYIHFYPQYFTEVMEKKGLILTARSPQESKEQKYKIPISLESIVDTRFVRKIEIV